MCALGTLGVDGVMRARGHGLAALPLTGPSQTTTRSRQLPEVVPGARIAPSKPFGRRSRPSTPRLAARPGRRPHDRGVIHRRRVAMSEYVLESITAQLAPPVDRDALVNAAEIGQGVEQSLSLPVCPPFADDDAE